MHPAPPYPPTPPVPSYGTAPGAGVRAGGIVARGLGVGALSGLIVGGTVGTLIVPVLGTFFGVLIGPAVGAALGLGCGVVLACVAPGPTTPSVALRTLAGGAAATAGALVALSIHAAGLWALVWIAVCGVIGVLVGPYVALGALRPAPGRVTRRAVGEPRRGGPRSGSTATVLVAGACVGAGAGAAVGLVIGLLSDPPALVVAAACEGAVLGTPCGLLIAALVAGVRAAVRGRL